MEHIDIHTLCCCSFTRLPAGEIHFCAFTIEHNCILFSVLAEFKNKYDLFVITDASEIE